MLKWLCILEVLFKCVPVNDQISEPNSFKMEIVPEWMPNMWNSNLRHLAVRLVGMRGEIMRVRSRGSLSVPST